MFSLSAPLITSSGEKVEGREERGGRSVLSKSLNIPNTGMMLPRVPTLSGGSPHKHTNGMDVKN